MFYGSGDMKLEVEQPAVSAAACLHIGLTCQVETVEHHKRPRLELNVPSLVATYQSLDFSASFTLEGLYKNVYGPGWTYECCKRKSVCFLTRGVRIPSHLQECFSEEPDFLLWTPAFGPLDERSPSRLTPGHCGSPLLDIDISDLHPCLQLHDAVSGSHLNAESAKSVPPLEPLHTPQLMLLPLPGRCPSAAH